MISELKQPHCSPRSATAMDTAESQANGHTSTVVLCCAPLQTCRAGPHCSPQSWGRMLPSSLLWQGQLTGSSGQGQQHALGLGMPLECRAAQTHTFPSEHTTLPCSSASPESPQSWLHPLGMSLLLLPCRRQQHCPSLTKNCFTRPLPQALGGSSIQPDPLLRTGSQPRETFFRE